MYEDIEKQIILQERKSARGDLRCRAFSHEEDEFDGFGPNMEEALQMFLGLNKEK